MGFIHRFLQLNLSKFRISANARVHGLSQAPKLLEASTAQISLWMYIDMHQKSTFICEPSCVPNRDFSKLNKRFFCHWVLTVIQALFFFQSPNHVSGPFNHYHIFIDVNSRSTNQPARWITSRILCSLQEWRFYRMHTDIFTDTMCEVCSWGVVWKKGNVLWCLICWNTGRLVNQRSISSEGANNFCNWFLVFSWRKLSGLLKINVQEATSISLVQRTQGPEL